MLTILIVTVLTELILAGAGHFRTALRPHRMA